MSGTGAKVLREAAAVMRLWAETAAADLSGPADDPQTWRGIGTGYRVPIKSHIASWHPAVALAVADWLDNTATRHVNRDLPTGGDDYYSSCAGCGLDTDGEPCPDVIAALAVARTYLGRLA